MEFNYFKNLPSEITTEILSRLSIRSLAISKSVCKSWRNLFDFVKSKIKTPTALVRIYQGLNSTPCKIIEIEDEDEVDLHYHPLTDVVIPHEFIATLRMGSTANELLLMYSSVTKGIPFYIFNLITREYIKLSYPDEYNPNLVLQYGFGVSKISGQYKVFLINGDTGSDSHYVYTLGTGTWRRVKAGAASGFRFLGVPILCNDNLHWTVYDSSNQIRIVCSFDVETECFSIFSLPPMGIRYGKLSVLRDCLCYSYYSYINNEVVIWMMKEYQVDESWTIEYKMSIAGSDLSSHMHYTSVEAIKLFKDGDVLMLLDSSIPVYYSNKTSTLQQVNVLNDADAKGSYALIFNPSLLSLKSFGFENVISF